jgi:hypothetical protein
MWPLESLAKFSFLPAANQRQGNQLQSSDELCAAIVQSFRHKRRETEVERKSDKQAAVLVVL